MNYSFSTKYAANTSIERSSPKRNIILGLSISTSCSKFVVSSTAHTRYTYAPLAFDVKCVLEPDQIECYTLKCGYPHLDRPPVLVSKIMCPPKPPYHCTSCIKIPKWASNAARQNDMATVYTKCICCVDIT